MVENHLTTCLKAFLVTYFMGKVTVSNVSILKSQMCPSWPRKKGSGQDEALGDSIEQVPKRHKYPLKQVAVLTNRDQKLYSCANRSWSSWTRFDSQQGLMSRWATRNTFMAYFFNAYTTGDSHSSEPFFTQVNHLVSSNRISKQVMNPADFSTLKIWDKSDHWFKSYGSKVNF